MPAFNTKPPIFISPGDSEKLVNDATTDTGISYTQAVVIAQSAGPSIGPGLTMQNTTDKTATVYVAVQDNPSATANYSALTDADTGTAITVAAGSTINFTTGGPFICAHFASAPTSGSLLIAR